MDPYAPIRRERARAVRDCQATAASDADGDGEQQRDHDEQPDRRAVRVRPRLTPAGPSSMSRKVGTAGTPEPLADGRGVRAGDGRTRRERRELRPLRATGRVEVDPAVAREVGLDPGVGVG